MKTSLGTHITWGVYHCNADTLSFIPSVKTVLNSIVEELQLSKVNESFKQFEPIGVTGFILLEESHVSIHTWPEHAYAAVDIFTCGEIDMEAGVAHLQKALAADELKIVKMKRGNLDKKAPIKG